MNNPPPPNQSRYNPPTVSLKTGLNYGVSSRTRGFYSRSNGILSRSAGSRLEPADSCLGTFPLWRRHSVKTSISLNSPLQLLGNASLVRSYFYFFGKVFTSSILAPPPIIKKNPCLEQRGPVSNQRNPISISGVLSRTGEILAQSAASCFEPAETCLEPADFSSKLSPRHHHLPTRGPLAKFPGKVTTPSLNTLHLGSLNLQIPLSIKRPNAYLPGSKLMLIYIQNFTNLFY